MIAGAGSCSISQRKIQLSVFHDAPAEAALPSMSLARSAVRAGPRLDTTHFVCLLLLCGTFASETTKII